MQTPELFFVTFSLTFLVICLLIPIARLLGLVDKPDQRKTHDGHVPLIGGLAIYLSVAILLLLTQPMEQRLICFLSATGLLVATGAIDDRFNLNVSFRVMTEVIAASIMILGCGLWIGNLGNLLGFGEIHMPFWIGYPFTLIAVFGVINAINMMDGVDGLAGGLGTTCFSVLLLATDNSATVNQMGPLFVIALLAFLLFNTNTIERLPKVFLGDAGSKLIGFTLVWAVIDTASGGPDMPGEIEPVTALYIIALPLFDMVATTIRRVRKGVSPFHPDRTHLHHVLLRAGYGKTTTLAIILVLSLLLNGMGIAFQQWHVPEVAQFLVFFGLYFYYAYNIRHAWKVSKWLKKSFAARPNPEAEHRVEVK